MMDEQNVNTDVTQDGVDTVVETPAITKEEYETLKAENQRLKAHHDKVTKEKQQAVAVAKAEADRIAREKAEADGDYAQLLALKDKEYKEALKAYEDKINAYEESKKKNVINEAAAKIANELAKVNPRRAKLLAEKLAGKIKFTDDGLKVVDENGTIVSERLETLADFAKREYDFLCDGLQSTGGGAPGGVRLAGKKFSEMDADEKAQLYNESPQKYNAAKAAG